MCVGPAIARCVKNVCYLMIVHAVCSNSVLFRFFAGGEDMSQLLLLGSITQKKQECEKI